MKAFAEENLLRLNVNKCEMLSFQRIPTLTYCLMEVEGMVMPAGDTRKYLGYWWKGDLLATKSVEENVQKARRAFFHYGSIGVF